MAYRAAIIGAGRIGAMLDKPNDPFVLTHAHAYSVCEGFELVGFVDRDLDKAKAASGRWGGDSYETVEELFQAHSVDVVSVCLPDDSHYAALLSLAERPLKFVFLEKPAVRTPAEAEVIGGIYHGLPVRVQVNYTRRFVPEIRSVREAIRNGGYGSFLAGTGYYGKGLLHNGSHLVDLLRYFVGEVGDALRIDEIEDFSGQDPSISASLTMRDGGRFHLCHTDSRQFHIFELDLIFERRRLRICELGTKIEMYSVGDNRLFDGYRTMNKESECPTQHSMAMYHAISNIRNNLERNEPLVCTLEESLETAKTCWRIMRGQAA